MNLEAEASKGDRQREKETIFVRMLVMDDAYFRQYFGAYRAVGEILGLCHEKIHIYRAISSIHKFHAFIHKAHNRDSPYSYLRGAEKQRIKEVRENV